MPFSLVFFLFPLEKKDKITAYLPAGVSGGVSFCTARVEFRLCIQHETKIAIFIVYKVPRFNSGTIKISVHVPYILTLFSITYTTIRLCLSLYKLRLKFNTRCSTV